MHFLASAANHGYLLTSSDDNGRRDHVAITHDSIRQVHLTAL